MDDGYLFPKAVQIQNIDVRTESYGLSEQENKLCECGNRAIIPSIVLWCAGIEWKMMAYEVVI